MIDWKSTADLRDENNQQLSSSIRTTIRGSIFNKPPHYTETIIFVKHE